MWFSCQTTKARIQIYWVELFNIYCFPQQQWLSERASTLRHLYVTCLVITEECVYYAVRTKPVNIIQANLSFLTVKTCFMLCCFASFVATRNIEPRGFSSWAVRHATWRQKFKLKGCRNSKSLLCCFCFKPCSRFSSCELTHKQSSLMSKMAANIRHSLRSNKKNALCGDASVHPSPCYLISATKPFVGFSWNFIWHFFKKICLVITNCVKNNAGKAVVF